MKVIEKYSFSFFPVMHHDLVLPLRLSFPGVTLEITDLDEARRYSNGFIERSIDPKALTLSEEKTRRDRTVEPPRIIVPGTDNLYSVENIIGTLSFMLDVAINFAGKPGDVLVPENAEDQELLTAFGTDEIDLTLHGQLAISSFSPSDIGKQQFNQLMQKDSGVALYAEALRHQHPTGIFRELWRTLEAAFGCKDKELIKHLSAFRPASELQFDEKELIELHKLRGRASHAESRAGLKEIRKVNKMVLAKLPRLKCLVQQVLLTKKLWGEPTSDDIERLADLKGFIGKNGEVMIIRYTKEDRG